MLLINTIYYNRLLRNIKFYATSRSPPYYNGMMCAVRFSKNMIKCIIDYASKNKTLFFLEALFPTIAKKNNLKYSNPVEFNNIHYRHDFEIKNINDTNLYHPVKNLYDHICFR